MTPIERIQKAHVAIMRHPTWCAFSGITAMGEVKIDASIPTACTDGRNVSYSPDFIASLDDAELRFVVLHENAGHKAYRHMHTWRHLWKEDARLANIAADHFVNLSLIDSDAGEGFITMPAVGIQPEPRYRGWSVQMIFDDLKQNPPPEAHGGGGNDPDDPDGGGGFDQHDWSASERMSEIDEGKHADEVQRALRQGEMVAKQRGKGKGGSNAVISDLLRPVVDWRQQLREFVQDTVRGGDESTWARPNRRFLADDMYMPSSESTQMGELAIVWDTSGSVFDSGTVTRFASELASVVERVRPSLVRVLYTDYGVQSEQTFEDGQFALANVKPEGGGGTDLTRAFKHITEKRYTPQACVVLSDLETPFGSAPPYPVLWCSTTRHTAPYGRTIHITV